MFWQRALVASFLATGAQAGIGGMVMEGLTRNSPAMERRLEEIAKANLQARGYLEVRQATVLGSNTPLKSDGSLDMDAWNEAANTACRDALKNLQLASNPSGACVCYNLPLLNNATGTFEADLRLFQLNEPTGQFQGIPQDKIEVELSYNGASVSEVSQQPVASPSVKPRQSNNSSSELRLLQAYLFVGQVDKDQMNGPVST
jgi:hypothetical protein